MLSSQDIFGVDVAAFQVLSFSCRHYTNGFCCSIAMSRVVNFSSSEFNRKQNNSVHNMNISEPLETHNIIRDNQAYIQEKNKMRCIKWNDNIYKYKNVLHPLLKIAEKNIFSYVNLQQLVENLRSIFFLLNYLFI